MSDASPEERKAPLPDADHQAQHFDRQRAADRDSLAQDYVELIADLLDTGGEARAIDVARRMGVTQATVTNTVARLVRAGLIDTQPYRGLFLTPAGRRMAEKSRARHRTVLRLLLALGVDAAVAEEDAEGIEHHVSDATLTAFERFLAERDPG